jgi:hypothetical protein
MTNKNRKKSRIFMFLGTGCSLLRAEGFSCSLGVLYGGLRISKLQFLIKKIEIKFPAINFRSSNPGSVSGSALNQCGSDTLPQGLTHPRQGPVLRIRIHQIHKFLGLLDPDPDPLVRGMDPDPAPDPSITKQK